MKLNILVNFISKKKRMIWDILLNLVSNILPLLLLNIMIFPILARSYSENYYGELLVLVAIISLIANPVGSALNNTRLLRYRLYNNKIGIGDFKYLLFLSLILSNIFFVIIYLFTFDVINYVDLIISVILICLTILRIYYQVAYRINLNFVHIFYSNLLLSVGYLIGLLVFFSFNNWLMILLIANMVSFAFINKTTNLSKESFEKTIHYPEVKSTFNAVFFSSLLINITNYADRILIFPILGSLAVANYYTASIFSKIIGLAIGPISGVLLSYIVKKESFNKKKLKSILLFSFLISIPSYFITYYSSLFLIYNLYPQLYSNSKELVLLTSFSAILTLISTIINPIVMGFLLKKYQIISNLIYVICYLGFSITLVYYYGLVGFAIGVIISKIIYLIIKIYILFKGQVEDHIKVL